MRPIIHRAALPPIFLGLHALLFLPLIFAPANPHSRFPLNASDESPQPPPASLWALFSLASADPAQGTVFARLHAKHSIPLGLLGFGVVYIVKQLAGKAPLPKDPRRKNLAARIEWSVLFLMGVVEELWRWWLVRMLIRYEGGEGGFRGNGLALALVHGQARSESTEAEAGSGVVGQVGALYLSIWPGVYFMGWCWSLIECVVSWWNVRPLSTTTTPTQHPAERNQRPEIQNSHPIRRPLLGKRTRSDSIIGGSEGDASESRVLLFNSFCRSTKKRGRGPQPSQCSGAEDMLRVGSQYSYQRHDTAPTEGESSATACDTSLRNAEAPIAIPVKDIKNIDLERGVIPRLQDIQRERERERDDDSDTGYGDDEDSDLDSDSLKFQSATPLLSSSMPYDPTQEHPHYESQALLANQHRQLSYNTLSDSLPVIPVVGDDNEVVSVHESDAEREERRVLNDAGDEDDNILQRSPGNRAYPSYPPYSASYNHSHFPFHPPPQTVAGPSALGISKARLAPSMLGRRMTAESAGQIPLTQQRHGRKIFGANINSLAPYLPVMWRITAALKHISHALLYAWAPALVFKKQFQWWALLIMVILAGKTGWHCLEWFGGGALRAGIRKASISAMIFAMVIYLVTLGIWGIL